MSSQGLDLLVVGGGIAGLTAALWAEHFGLTVEVLESSRPGGQLRTLRAFLPDYPGLPGIEPGTLADVLEAQVRARGLGPAPAEVTSLSAGGDGVDVTLAGGQGFTARTVLIATGTRARRPDVPGADLPGEVRDGEAAVVLGDGDAAAATCEALADAGTEVVWLVRANRPSARPNRLDPAMDTGRVRLVTGARLLSVEGSGAVEGVTFTVAEGGAERVAASAFMPRIGRLPVVPPLEPMPELDAAGHLSADGLGRTSVPRLLAAGDVVGPASLYMAPRAAGQGAAAARGALSFLIRR